MGEENSFQRLRGTDLDTPGDLAAVDVLGLVGDADALGAGVVAEALHPPGGTGGTLATLGLRQTTDDGDFLTVDDHRRVTGEPPVGKPAGEPFRGLGGIGLVGLLPTARTPTGR